MDYNNLQSRIERLYLSLGDRYEYNLDDGINVKGSLLGDDPKVHVTFGKLTDAQLNKAVLDIISAIADFKDHILKHMKLKNQDVAEVTKLINHSFELSVILDINNLNKHGDPLTQRYRSKIHPYITNLRQAIGLSTYANSRTASIMIGQNGPLSQQGDVKLVIMGDIIDENGVKHMDLDNMISHSVDQLERFIGKYKLTTD